MKIKLTKMKDRRHGKIFIILKRYFLSLINFSVKLNMKTSKIKKKIQVAVQSLASIVRNFIIRFNVRSHFKPPTQRHFTRYDLQ